MFKVNTMYRIKGHKRSIETINDPAPDELYDKINNMPEPYRSLAAFLYLTGNRVSEVLGIPYEERMRKSGNPHNWKVEPIEKRRISVTGNMLRVYARTLKRKNRPTHIYVCRIDLPEEKRYFEIVKKRYDSIEYPSDYVWNFGRTQAWRFINKATGLPPHKLRGLRATRDAVDFELDAIDLKQKFNWGSPEMAFHYASKSSHDIERKLQRMKE